MRYMVDGVETNLAGYLAAPAGKCKAISSLDDDSTIRKGLEARRKALVDGKGAVSDPCTVAQLDAEIVKLGG